MTNPIRILLMHGQPLVREGLQSFIRHNADRFSLVSRSAPTFLDGVALYRTEKPDLVLVDLNIPLSYNQRGSVSPDRLADFKIQADVPIVLLYAPPARLSSALLLLRSGIAAGLIETAGLQSTTTLGDAVERVLAGQSYIYYERQVQKLADLAAGQEFFSLKDDEIMLLELLARTQCIKGVVGELGLSPSSVYRRLFELAKKFDVKSWKHVVRHAQNMGVLHESKVVSRIALRSAERSNDFFSPQAAMSDLP